MSCSFDLAHYGEIVAAAKAGGYRFAHFEGSPLDGTVILRHDVDLSLDAALRMAEIEHGAGASATYFLMTESVFYNLDSSEGVAAIATAARARPPRRIARGLPQCAARTNASTRSSPGTTPTPSTCGHCSPTAGSTSCRSRGSTRPPTAPTRTSTGARAVPTTTCERAHSRGCSCSPTPRSGRIPAKRWVRRCGRCWRPSGDRRLRQLADDRIDLG